MNREEIESKIKDMVKKGAEVSKDAFEKAGNKVQNLTDKSVLLIEKKKLENKRSQKYSELGEKIFELIESELLKVDSCEIDGMISEIKDLNNAISQKEALM